MRVLFILIFGFIGSANAENTRAPAQPLDPICLAPLVGSVHPQTDVPPALKYPAPSIDVKVKVGDELSLFYRGGENQLTSVQVRAVSGSRPLNGGFFPAGNSGAMSMIGSKKKTKLTIRDGYYPVQFGDHRGIAVPMTATNLEVENGRHIMRIESAALANIRFLRDHVVADHGDWVEYGMKPSEIYEESKLTVSGDLYYSRISLSGKAEYTLRIHPEDGAKIEMHDDKWVIVGGLSDKINFTITPTTSEPPRVGVPIEKLVEPEYLAQMTDDEKQLFAFLFFEDGAVAGSHAYLTTFGRDPLITAMIAKKALTPYCLKLLAAAAMDTIYDDSINPDTTHDLGNIAHEPTQGERASFERLQKDTGPKQQFYDDAIIYDYSMIDAQFLLMPVMEALLEKTNPSEVNAFLAQKSRKASGRTYDDLLSLNKDRIIQQASAFALAEMNRPGNIPDPANYVHLIKLLDGRSTGDWRDSHSGLAFGRYPFGTNVSLVPAALKAILSLQALNLRSWTNAEANTVRSYYEQWRIKPYSYFLVTIDNATARQKAEDYARKLDLNIPPVDPFHGRPLKFFAISLDENGKPIPVMHSDVSFTFLYTNPPPEYLWIMLQPLRLPYPWGLDAPAGQFIATPAYASVEIQKWFKMVDYHAVVWSFMQEMAASGLKNQSQRTDLSPKLQARINSTHFYVWRAIIRNLDWRPIELWAARVVNHIIERMSYGTGTDIKAESCANQLWSKAKIANFAPPGWDDMDERTRNDFLTWNETVPLEGNCN